MLVLSAFFPVDVATVRLPRSGNRLFAAVRVQTGADICLGYRHSVEKSAVQGCFRVGPGPVLQALETRMASTGTGLPNTHSQTTRREGDWIVKDEGLKEIPGFDFFVSPINAPQLVINGNAIAIQTLAPGSVIRLDVEKIRLGQWYLRHYFKIDWKKVEHEKESKH